MREKWETCFLIGLLGGCIFCLISRFVSNIFIDKYIQGKKYIQEKRYTQEKKCIQGKISIQEKKCIQGKRTIQGKKYIQEKKYTKKKKYTAMRTWKRDKLIGLQKLKQKYISVRLWKCFDACDAVSFVSGAMTAMLCFWRFGLSFALINVFLFVCCLMQIAIVDSRRKIIPDILNMAVFGMGICSAFTMPGLSLASRLGGSLIVSFPLILISIFMPGGIGGGDIKLMAAGGIFMGWERNLGAALLGIFAGGLYGLFLLTVKKAGRKDSFAFGPFLCLGMAVELLLVP